MQTFRTELAEALAQVVGVAAEELAGLFEYPPRRDLGDFAFPCFTLAKRLRKSPAAIAKEAAEAIRLPPDVAWARAAGPYVNFGLRAEALCRRTLTSAREAGKRWGRSEGGGGRTVVIDYSSPNISKHLAFHHIRSTMIGQCLVNLHRATGWKVVGINHLGDWGTTFGQLMSAVDRWTETGFLARATLQDLNALYVRFHEEAEKEPSLTDEARAWFKKLEDGDAEATRMWEAFRRISLAEFERVYAKLGVAFDEITGESFFLDRLEDTVRKVEATGIVTRSEGALVVDLEAEGMPPALLRKQDGATLYLTRDLAAALYRQETYGFDRALYVTDAGQALHFRQLFAVLQKMGFGFAGAMEHVPFGVLLMGGQKGKSRKGGVILLEDVLDEAAERTRAMIAEKNPDLADAERVAAQVGVGAVVFNDLKNKRIKDVNFRWEEVLALEGDSGPYVQYAHVRTCGIFRKYGGPPPDTADFSRLAQAEETDLAHRIGRFPEVVRRACETFEPSVLAQYLLEISASFHRFHHRHRVLSDDETLTQARLVLVDAARTTLRAGLEMLGLAAPEEM